MCVFMATIIIIYSFVHIVSASLNRTISSGQALSLQSQQANEIRKNLATAAGRLNSSSPRGLWSQSVDVILSRDRNVNGRARDLYAR